MDVSCTQSPAYEAFFALRVNCGACDYVIQSIVKTKGRIEFFGGNPYALEDQKNLVSRVSVCVNIGDVSHALAAAAASHRSRQHQKIA